VETTHEHDENRPQQAEEHGHHDADHPHARRRSAGHGDHAAKVATVITAVMAATVITPRSSDRLFWIMLALSIPTVLLNSVRRPPELRSPRRRHVGQPDPRHGHLRLGWAAIPHRGRVRDRDRRPG
jgi:hypothetical protein